jgi:hypothetical protein
VGEREGTLSVLTMIYVPPCNIPPAILFDSASSELFELRKIQT